MEHLKSVGCSFTHKQQNKLERPAKDKQQLINKISKLRTKKVHWALEGLYIIVYGPVSFFDRKDLIKNTLGWINTGETKKSNNFCAKFQCDIAKWE